jgi:hypothetical protein
MRGLGIALFATLLFAEAARAQVSRSFPGPPAYADWSATAARTVGTGQNVVTGEAGWPGIAFQYLHGIDARTDIGARVAFNYGFVNTTNNLNGLDLQVPMRRFLTTSGSFDIEAHASPGFTFYGNHSSTLFAIGGPLGLLAAYRVDPRLTVDVGVDVPLLLSLTNPTGFLFGPLIGVGAEYQIENNLAVTAKFRVGPEFAFDSAGASSQFAFQTLVGIAYAMR